MAALSKLFLDKGSCSGETQDPKTAESANERMNSDLEVLGDCSKKLKLDKSDPLLNKIACPSHQAVIWGRITNPT